MVGRQRDETNKNSRIMEEGVLAIMWLIILSVGVLITIVYIRKFVNQERLSMIEKGINPADVAVSNRRANNPIWPLRFALLLIGAGLGLFVGYFLDMALDMEEVAYFSMFFVFAGAGLAISYVIEDKKEKERSLAS